MISVCEFRKKDRKINHHFKVVFAVAEASPLIRIGGLSDVAGNIINGLNMLIYS